MHTIKTQIHGLNTTRHEIQTLFAKCLNDECMHVCVLHASPFLFAIAKPVVFLGATDNGDEEIDVLELDSVGLRLLGNETDTEPEFAVDWAHSDWSRSS